MHEQKVTFSGSREWSRSNWFRMQHWVRTAVERAAAQGFQIIVGDNPQGVDLCVIQKCRELAYNKVIVCGIADKPRNGGVSGAIYFKIDRDMSFQNARTRIDAYTQRDRYMVDCADIVLAVWNGNSPGTKRAYDYAIKRGKKATLKMF